MDLARLHKAAAHGDAIGLECHAGHGLTFDTVTAVAAIPTRRELNIGHCRVCAAVVEGLPASISSLHARMRTSRRP